MTPITKPNSFSRRLIRKKLHMMGRAAKWKLKFWPDVEVFIFALEITSQIATWFLFHTVNMGCFVDINTIDYKVKVLSNSSLIFMTANSLFDVFIELIDFFFAELICCFTVMWTLSKSTCASIEVFY